MKVIIIGGGAAGMLAAYQAAKCGNDVSLYEKNENTMMDMNGDGFPDIIALP